MRIVFVADEPLLPTNSGGRAATRSDIEVLRAQGHAVDVVICAPRDLSSESLAAHREAFGTVRVLALRSVLWATLRHPTFPLFCARRMPAARQLDVLVTELREGDPVDVVIAAHEYSLPLATCLHESLGCRLILRSHNDEASYFQGLALKAGPVRRLHYRWDATRLRRRMRRLVDPVDAVALISPDDAGAYPQTSRQVTVPPVLGAPVGLGAGFDARDERLVFVGSLDVAYARHGIAWFLDEVWPLVRSRCPDAVVELVGRGLRRDFADVVATSSGVVLTGELPDIATALDRARVFINPVFEGSGVNMKVGPPLERGLPVVTTPVGVRGLAGLTGGLTIASTPRDFADACLSLLTDADRWSRASRAGREALTAAYSPPVVGRAWASALALATDQEGVR